MSRTDRVTKDVEPLLEESIEIAAPPARVWELVSDLRNMGRWSPQCRKTWVKGGETRLGATAVNLNRRGLLHWPTQTKVVAFDPEQKIAFKVRENHSVWSYTLEPTTVDAAPGTRLTARREAPDGTSKISWTLVEKVLGGQQTFQSELVQGMRQTLERIKADAER